MVTRRLVPAAVCCGLICSTPAPSRATDADANCRRQVEAAVAAIDGLGTTWRVMDVIPGLDARYGTFADLDGDGDLDYVATEMLHGPERVSTFLRETGTDGRPAWRRAATFGEALQNRHPQRPWVIADGGNGHPSIVVPTGWAPYVTVFRTDGAGRPVGKPQPLHGALPKRLSKPFGVDNNPYRITAVEPARGERPAHVVGTLIDEADDGDRTVEKEWRIALNDAGATLVRIAGLRTPPRRLDAASIPDELPAAGGRGACAHVSGRRGALLEPLAHDVDDDGTDDLVLVGGDFAAHVLRGREDPGKGLTFEPELSTARPLPLADARAWLGVGDVEDGSWAQTVQQAAFLRGFWLQTIGRGDDPVTLLATCTHGPPSVTTYFWNRTTLVPVYRERQAWPARDDDALIETHVWEDHWADATGDGCPDALSVGVGRAVRFVDGRREPVGDDLLRPSIVFWKGESGVDEAIDVATFDVEANVPEDPNAGMPISLESVRVEGAPDRDVRCIYVRPWKVGIFVEQDASRLPEPAARVEAEARLWLRRGDDLSAEPHALDTCDLGRCRRGRRLSGERWRDAMFCYRRAAALAGSGTLADAARRGEAACREALGMSEPEAMPPATWVQVDRRAAKRIVQVSRRARRADQLAMERRLLTRVLDLNPDDAAARIRLGWRRVKGEWRRTPDAEAEVELRENAAGGKTSSLTSAWDDVERWRADQLLELAARDGLTARERALLLRALVRAPDHDGIHRALGHVWTGGGWARPELVPAAERLDVAEARWKAIAEREVAVRPVPTQRLDGLPDGLPTYSAEGGRHTVGLPLSPERRERLGRRLAAAPARLNALVEDLFGDTLPVWSVPGTWYLDRKAYFAAIDARLATAAQRRAQRSISSFDSGGELLLWVGSSRRAADLALHVTAFRSAYFGLIPRDPVQLQEFLARGEDAYRPHAWFKEGLAYFATLELLDSADTWMFTSTETSGKTRAADPPPRPRGRAECLRYVRRALVTGEALTLRQLFGRSLNNLDLLGSLQGWSFLRFAAAHDPEGLRRLPDALRAEQDGSLSQRGVRAVETAFDTDLDELERLWRTFTLEVR